MSVLSAPSADQDLLKTSTSSKRLIKIPVKELNELLTCYLCRGYYQQANTIPDCLHTFCRVCIVRYVLEHSTSSNIRCPKCDTDLGTYSQITKKMKHDRNLQVICDTLFPSFTERQQEEKPKEDSVSTMGSKEVEISEQKDEMEVQDEDEALSEIASSSKKKDTPSTAAKSGIPTETGKKVNSLPQKSLQNILGHKLLATELLFKSSENSLAENSKKRKSETENRTLSKLSTEKSEDESSGRVVKRAKAVNENNETRLSDLRSPSRAPIEAPSGTTRPEIPVVNLGSVDQTALSAKSSSQGKDFLIKLSSDDSDAALKLPPLPKPNFHSGLKVQVTKIQSFIFTRFPEDLKQKISVNDVDVLYEGKSILNFPDLTHLTPLVQEKVVQLSYRRLS